MKQDIIPLSELTGERWAKERVVVLEKKLRQFKAYCKKLKLEAEEANKKMFLMFGNCTVECEYAKQLKAENERLRGEVAEYAQVNADLHKDNLSLLEKAEL